MSTPQNNGSNAETQQNNGFFINQGTFAGWFTTQDGDIYDIRELKPREVTHPTTGEVSTIWGGYATARDRNLAAQDAMMQKEFNNTGKRPAEFFPDERANDIPLYITLREHEGKGFDLIGSFWNSKGRHTILARDLEGKRGLRFGGNVLPWKSPETLEAERAAKADAAEQPDGDKARAGAGKRASKGRNKCAKTGPAPGDAA
jgi:hypothetical protein